MARCQRVVTIPVYDTNIYPMIIVASIFFSIIPIAPIEPVQESSNCS